MECGRTRQPDTGRCLPRQTGSASLQFTCYLPSQSVGATRLNATALGMCPCFGLKESEEASPDCWLQVAGEPRLVKFGRGFGCYVALRGRGGREAAVRSTVASCAALSPGDGGATRREDSGSRNHCVGVPSCRPGMPVPDHHRDPIKCF